MEKQKEDPDFKKYELKFESGGYMSPERLSKVREHNEFMESQWSTAPGTVTGSAFLEEGGPLPRKEYMWLERNHPEYTGAYDRPSSPAEIALALAIGIPAVAGTAAFLCWAGYKVIERLTT